MSERSFNGHYDCCICDRCCQRREQDRQKARDTAANEIEQRELQRFLDQGKSETPADPLKDPLYVRLAARREFHLTEALKFAHLGNLVYESGSMTPHSRTAFRNLLEAVLAHI